MFSRKFSAIGMVTCSVFFQRAEISKSRFSCSRAFQFAGEDNLSRSVDTKFEGYEKASSDFRRRMQDCMRTAHINKLQNLCILISARQYIGRYSYCKQLTKPV